MLLRFFKKPPKLSLALSPDIQQSLQQTQEGRRLLSKYVNTLRHPFTHEAKDTGGEHVVRTRGNGGVGGEERALPLLRKPSYG